MTDEQKAFAYEQAVRAAVDVATRGREPNAFSDGAGDRSAAEVAEEVVKAARKAAELINGCGTAGDRCPA